MSRGDPPSAGGRGREGKGVVGGLHDTHALLEGWGRSSGTGEGAGEKYYKQHQQ